MDKILFCPAQIDRKQLNEIVEKVFFSNKITLMSLREAKQKNKIPRFSRNRLRNLKTGSEQTSQCQQEIASLRSQ